MRTLTAIAFAFATLLASAQAPTKAMELAQQGALVVDVRQPDELAQLAYDAPHVVNIPLDQLTARMAEIPKDVPVVLACRSGGRSAQAMALLKEKEYTNLTDLEGGIYAWQEAGLPVKKGQQAGGACCAGGKASAAGCGDAKGAANCTPAQKAAGCCSAGDKAAAPAPAEKKKTRKK